MQELGVHSEVGKLHTVMVCRPGLAHQRLTPATAADLLFDDVLWVPEAQKRPPRFRAQDARARRRGARPARDAGRDPAGQGGARLGARPARHAQRRRPRHRPAARLARRASRAQARRAPDRRHRDTRRSEERVVDHARGGVRRHRVPAAAGSEHAVPARSLVLDLQRRHGQPDVLAGAQARDPAAARGLQVPPQLQGRTKIWWGDSDESFGASTLEGGDVMPIGKGVGADRHGRAHDAPGGLPGGGAGCSSRRRRSASSAA